jgi:hypothetical protein
MVRLNCGKCDHQWDYTGQNSDYATCPDCDASVQINPSGREDATTGSTTPVGIPETDTEEDEGLREMVEETNRLLQEILDELRNQNTE